MTTAQSRQLTGRSATSMVVAEQPNTVRGLSQDEEPFYIASYCQGNLPSGKRSQIDYWESFPYGTRNSRLIYGFSVGKGGQGYVYALHSAGESESVPQLVSMGDVQETTSDITMKRPGDSFVSMEGSFLSPLRDQRHRVVVRSVDDNAHKWIPSLVDTQMTFEVGTPETKTQVPIYDGWPRLWRENDEPSLNVDPKVTRSLLPFDDGFFVAFHAKSDVYDKRIETLRGFAADEEITVNETSVRDFRYFVDSVVPTQNAQLVVMDNGNLRAVWKNDDGSHLGLQFLGGQVVQYVVFRRGGLEGEVYRLAGENSFDEMRKSIEVWGLSSLMSA